MKWELITLAIGLCLGFLMATDPAIQTGVDLRNALGLGDSKVSPEFREELNRALFLRTWVEWSAENQEQIWRRVGTSTKGDTNMFTVPTDTDLFITSAWIQVIQEQGVGTVGSTSEISIDTKIAGQDIVVAIRSNENDDGTSSIWNINSMTFPMPLRVPEGSTVIANLGTDNSDLNAGFHGFLQRKTR